MKSLFYPRDAMIAARGTLTEKDKRNGVARGARAMWKGFRVIDADAHMHEPQYLWERYIEPKYREQVPKVAYMNGTFMVYEPDGKFVPKQDIEKRPAEKIKAWRTSTAKAIVPGGHPRHACMT
jgi:hypothetical protein